MGRIFGNIDWVIILLLFVIACFGLFVILSISQTLFIQQLVFIAIGVVILVCLSNIDAAILLWTSPFGFVISIVLLLLSYAGPSIRGATRWIIVGPSQLQPSELIKPFLILFYSWMIVRFPPRKLTYFPLHLIVFLVPFFLVFQQPDLGSSLVYLTLWTAMMVAGGFPLVVFVSTLVTGMVTVPFLWKLLQSYQRDRILTFLNPALDPRGAGYNAIQAMIAVGSGRLFGRGLGRGTQSHLRFLPEYHTDFIFASLVEELGFIGGAILLVTYALLLLRIIAPFIRGRIVHDIPYVYSCGLFAMLMAQIVINTGMNMGIVPITGITLPLVSYGGSSILSIAVAFGILMSLRRAFDRTNQSVAI